jgi:hypothetical protein
MHPALRSANVVLEVVLQDVLAFHGGAHQTDNLTLVIRNRTRKRGQGRRRKWTISALQDRGFARVGHLTRRNEQRRARPE